VSDICLKVGIEHILPGLSRNRSEFQLDQVDLILEKNLHNGKQGMGWRRPVLNIPLLDGIEDVP